MRAHEWLNSIFIYEQSMRHGEVLASGFVFFNFLFTIGMKVLISCTENPNFFIEILDDLELFIDKKVIFDEKYISIGPPRRAACQQIL
jgi:hypothetical protein